MSCRVLRTACVAVVLFTALPAAGATAQPGEPAAPADVGRLLVRLQGLYQQAEEATEAYNATEVALRKRQEEERRLSGELGVARNALGKERAEAGRLARVQYQEASGGLSPYARMLLSGDPQQALERQRMTGREALHRAAVVSRLAGAEKRAGTLATQARKALDGQQALAAEQKKHKEQATARLKEVERLLASLTADQLAELSARERAGTDKAQRALLESGRLPARTGTPTAAGGAALGYATAQLGKPYVWGAEGPASFDCSGLTSQAWAHAGRTIPRTSQEQWAQLPKVPLDQLRPGDLVVYFPKATHVAIYAGDGKVIQAPRPGAKVKVSPIAANPLLGAVRPDPAGIPLDPADYTPPRLPEAASEGDDSGYSAEAAPAGAAATSAAASAR
ncbi:glycoside hydrolase [Streptomyces venezuelae]|uniref:Glycoside hydrolase n=1 Tax=Streptomyces venezuelae TaxID=54571 RepID=A0A5P2D122_STRVZ|nr:C40 family peptidase [Streptomyces venezuelae]QES48260.1 glycoside hydrolase [Streptomyces venezuelae]